jgi:ankyrin repeat protein
MASYEGYVKVMKKLVAHGADINAFANDAGPVLNAAIGSGNREAVELLIDQGVELSIENNENADIPPPLAAAALNSDTALFDFLISKCANKLPAHDYDQALLHAAEAGQTEVFEKLLAYDHPEETYQAAMEVAAEEDEWGIVKTILERRTGLNCHKLFVKAATAFEDQSQILRAVWRHTKKTLPVETINQALYEATDCENADIVQILLEEFDANPNAEAPVSDIDDNENEDDADNEGR